MWAAGLDGYLYAYDAVTGQVLWQFDSWQEFDNMNGLPANGGTVDVSGPLVADDWLFLQSGYGSTSGQGGNALIAFALEGER